MHNNHNTTNCKWSGCEQNTTGSQRRKAKQQREKNRLRLHIQKEEKTTTIGRKRRRRKKKPCDTFHVWRETEWEQWMRRVKSSDNSTRENPFEMRTETIFKARKFPYTSARTHTNTYSRDWGILGRGIFVPWIHCCWLLLQKSNDLHAKIIEKISSYFDLIWFSQHFHQMNPRSWLASSKCHRRMPLSVKNFPFGCH